MMNDFKLHTPVERRVYVSPFISFLSLDVEGSVCAASCTPSVPDWNEGEKDWFN